MVADCNCVPCILASSTVLAIYGPLGYEACATAMGCPTPTIN